MRGGEEGEEGMKTTGRSMSTGRSARMGGWLCAKRYHGGVLFNGRNMTTAGAYGGVIWGQAGVQSIIKGDCLGIWYPGIGLHRILAFREHWDLSGGWIGRYLDNFSSRACHSYVCYGDRANPYAYVQK